MKKITESKKLGVSPSRRASAALGVTVVYKLGFLGQFLNSRGFKGHLHGHWIYGDLWDKYETLDIHGGSWVKFDSIIYTEQI